MSLGVMVIPHVELVALCCDVPYQIYNIFALDSLTFQVFVVLAV